MKTPDEIKKGLECIGGLHEPCIPGCPYEKCCECGLTAARDAIELIQQLESTISQVNKVLCGKENATLEELLQAADQVKNDLQYTTDAANIMKDEALKFESRLAQVEKERDAAVRELPHHCWNCKYHLDNPIEETDDNGRTIHRYCDADYCFPDDNSSWQWRGVYPENTKDVADG